MFVQQVSVFLQNASGRMADVLGTLAENDIDLLALSIADTSDYGILRLIVNAPEKAVAALKGGNYLVNTADVIAVAVEDSPGGLYKAVTTLTEAKISIEYMYAFFGYEDKKALVIVRVENTRLAVETLEKAGITSLAADKVYAR